MSEKNNEKGFRKRSFRTGNVPALVLAAAIGGGIAYCPKSCSLIPATANNTETGANDSPDYDEECTRLSNPTCFYMYIFDKSMTGTVANCKEALSPLLETHCVLMRAESACNQVPAGNGSERRQNALDVYEKIRLSFEQRCLKTVEDSTPR